MSRRPASSGDPIADRRFAHARDYAAAGDPAAAAELAEQALERAEDWAPGWLLLGEFHETAGAREAAIAAYERALALDPGDRCGAVLRLARLGARPTPAAPPPEHVAALFDDYAARFEDSLVNKLGYRAPNLIAEEIDAVAGARRFGLGVDLGCGTGLMARALAGRVDRLEGVDLAPAMIAAARATGLYAALSVGDVTENLAARGDGTVDLITAADVFCYLGDLGGVLAEGARVSRTGGLFAFTVETGKETEDARLRDSLRYAHGRVPLEATVRRVGLSILRRRQVVLRRDRDRDVDGTIYLLTKS